MIKQAFYVVVFAWSMIVSSMVRADSAETIQFATDPWPPYFLETDNNVVSQGLGLELVKAIFQEIKGVQVSFPKVPWKRALLDLKTGHKDAIALLLKSDERSEYMVFTDPIIKSEGRLFYNRAQFPSGFEWQKITDLKPYVLGVVRGYSYGPLLDNYIQTHPKSIYEVRSSQQLFSMLKLQRLDFASESVAVAKEIAQEQHWLDSLGVVAKPINTDVLYIGISRKSKWVAILPKMNAAIKKLTEDGTIDRIFGDVASSMREH